jgi:hypothetical protein
MLEATPHDAKRQSRYQRLAEVITRLRLECRQEMFRQKSSAPETKEVAQPADGIGVAA